MDPTTVRTPRRQTRALAAAAAVAALAAGCTVDDGPSGAPTPIAPPGGIATTTSPGTDSTGEATTVDQPVTGRLPEPEVLATGLAAPWGVASLPNGEALIAERDTGRILQLNPGGRPREVMRLTSVEAAGEAGLLGLAVSPAYADDHFVYAYYTSERDNRIVRFRLGGGEEVIVDGIDKAHVHDGGRLAFGPDGMLYATTGDAGARSAAQDPGNLNGKILRMRPDGSAPPDNPFPGSVVYSYGHRNVQGIAWDSAGRLWASEYGSTAWDELNLIRPGANYGWPQVEGRGETDGGRYTNPVVTWRTDEASPSGVAFWRGALYVGALRGQRLWRVPVDQGGNTGRPESLLRGTYGRLRTVIVASDGSLWVTTSNRDGRGREREGDDRLLRFSPP
jgi:glucose/arabinose dehydrogenase